MNTENDTRYCLYDACGHHVEAAMEDETRGETAVYLDGQRLDTLPADYVLGFHIHDGDLYIIYSRAIRLVRSIDGGNTTPDEGYTLEMQDYYSYEAPKMLADNAGTLWAHIGGRLFRRDGDLWTQAAEFPAGDGAEVTDEGKLKFSKNLLRDEITAGCRIYDPSTGRITDSDL